MTVRELIQEITTKAPDMESEVYFDFAHEDGSGKVLELYDVTDADGTDGLFMEFKEYRGNGWISF